MVIGSRTVTTSTSEGFSPISSSASRRAVAASSSSPSSAFPPVWKTKPAWEESFEERLVSMTRSSPLSPSKMQTRTADLLGLVVGFPWEITSLPSFRPSAAPLKRRVNLSAEKGGPKSLSCSDTLARPPDPDEFTVLAAIDTL